ncbi:MAG: leucine-rich repeat protein, partial [Lachnospiraceae bacterium]|nr:leucine-rich repeat protein [Lachnospiraceae bacterium]MCI8496361.1 leucine-rich repeat protein [Lachnospiraceae bacterium]
TALKEIAIGKKVSKIGKKAFYNCKNLKKVQYLATAVKKIETQAFKKTNAKMTVTVPKGTSTKTRNNIKSMMIKAGMNKKATVK